jgi:hypothetical protein
LQEERHTANAALRFLYTGQPWNDVVRRACRAWLLDGRWVDFWGAYVSMLSPAERARWRRTLAKPGDPAQRAWRLVSAGLLLGKD